MTGADDETQSRRTVGLGDSAERATFAPQQTGQVVAKQLLGRWKMVGTIVVTAITTVALYMVDETMTLDVWAFGFFTFVLIMYTLLTLRSDVKIE